MCQHSHYKLSSHLCNAIEPARAFVSENLLQEQRKALLEESSQVVSASGHSKLDVDPHPHARRNRFMTKVHE